MLRLNQLPDTARIWIFPLQTEAEEGRQSAIQQGLNQLVSSWKAHGVPLRGAAEIVANRFIVIAADEDASAPSGCSIDSMFKDVRKITSANGVDLSAADSVFYKDQDRIIETSRSEFGALVANGKIASDTIVFDNSITTLNQFTAGKWELPFSESWHSRAF